MCVCVSVYVNVLVCVCVCCGGAGLTLVAWLRSYEESVDNTGVKRYLV